MQPYVVFYSTRIVTYGITASGPYSHVQGLYMSFETLYKTASKIPFVMRVTRLHTRGAEWYVHLSPSPQNLCPRLCMICLRTSICILISPMLIFSFFFS